MGWFSNKSSGDGAGSYTPDDARADNEGLGREAWIRNGGDRDAIERRALRDGIGGYDTTPDGW